MREARRRERLSDATPSTRRPGERRDPYSVSSGLSAEFAALLSHQRQGLWVPAFAGTTWGELVATHSLTPPPARRAARGGAAALRAPARGRGRRCRRLPDRASRRTRRCRHAAVLLLPGRR